MDLRVLHRDSAVLALDKPAGVLTVPGRGPEAEAPSLAVRARTIAPDALPVHRLDRDTSGIVVFGLGHDAHRALCSSFAARRAEKVYLALCRGDLADRQRCDVPLATARRGGMRLARRGEKGAQPARTELRPLERFSRFTLVEARPRTGRTHQVRLHLAALGIPLALDPRYGDEAPLRASDLDDDAAEPDRLVLGRTPLHASALRIPHPSGRGWLHVESPLPEDLALCLALLHERRRGGPL